MMPDNNTDNHECSNKPKQNIMYKVIFLVMSFIFIVMIIIGGIWFVNASGEEIFKGIIGGLVLTFVGSFCFIKICIDSVWTKGNMRNIENSISSGQILQLNPFQQESCNTVPVSNNSVSFTENVPSDSLVPSYFERITDVSPPSSCDDSPPSYEEATKNSATKE